MRLTTDDGKSFQINWAWAPANADGDLMLEVQDTRSMQEIAKDFEGVAHFHRESDTEGDADYDGYTGIRILSRLKNGRVQITLCKPDGGETHV